MLRLAFPKAIEYERFTLVDWRAYPKEYFHNTIKAWCEKHGFVQYVAIGKNVPAKLPYRKTDDSIEVASDFLKMVAARRKWVA